MSRAKDLKSIARDLHRHLWDLEETHGITIRLEPGWTGQNSLTIVDNDESSNREWVKDL